MVTDGWWYGGILLAGLLVGSFLNVLIHRLPRLAADGHGALAALAWPRSHCPACERALPARHLLPLVSWFALRGRCGFCRAAISRRYPLVEGGTAVLFGLLAWLQPQPWLLAGGCVFSAALLALAVIDLETGLLPDDLTLPLLWLGLLFNLRGGRVMLEDAVLGAVAGYLLLWGLYWLHWLVSRREGLGYGDFKLLAAMGAWLGWQAIPSVLFVSALTGLCVAGILMLSGRMKRQDALPFGPWLALSGWAGWLGLSVL